MWLLKVCLQSLLIYIYIFITKVLIISPSYFHISVSRNCCTDPLVQFHHNKGNRSSNVHISCNSPCMNNVKEKIARKKGCFIFHLQMISFENIRKCSISTYLSQAVSSDKLIFYLQRFGFSKSIPRVHIS